MRTARYFPNSPLEAAVGAQSFPSTAPLRLAARLHAIDASPWAEWTGAKALSARGLAKVLGIFSIKPEKPTPSERGYSRRQFVDAWVRFLPSVSRDDATSATSATPTIDRTTPVAGVADTRPTEQDHHHPGVDPYPTFWDDHDQSDGRIVALEAEEAPSVHRTPLTPPRPCPACHGMHPVGTTCTSRLDADSPAPAWPSPPPCKACGTTAWATRDDGTTYCGTCHPATVGRVDGEQTTLGWLS